MIGTYDTSIIAAFWPMLDGIFSTQGVMVMLLIAYGGAMWMFLSSAPKVHTIMVSDLEVARQFYEGELQLSQAEVPLHYYYNYEQTLGMAAIDPLYMPTSMGQSASMGQPATKRVSPSDGLWYQLRKNIQLHIITGASLGEKNRQRHVCFDRDCLEQLLLKVQSRHVRHKVRQDKPLHFLVKDYQDRVIELVEVSN
jgi:hypothetical protein